MTEAEVVALVRREIAKAGSLRRLAREWKVSPSYLCGIARGDRSPGLKALKPLGLMAVKTVDYRRTK